MFKNQCFRLSASTFGVRLEGNKLARTVLIPRNSVIEIVGGVENPRKMIEVDWHGLRLLVFIKDIQDCGEPVGRCRAA